MPSGVAQPPGSVARRAEQDAASERSADDRAAVITLSELDALLRELASQGFEIFGPKVSAGAVVYARIGTIADVARGASDEQRPGRYALAPARSDAVFAYTAPAQSLKPLFHVSTEQLVRLRRRDDRLQVFPVAARAPRVAVLGARACDVAGLLVQDRTLLGVDPRYTARREGLFLISVNCATAGETCFCASMGTGPRTLEGHDLCLTEMTGPDGPRFLVEVGTQAGRELLGKIATEPATEEERAAPARAARSARAAMGRTLEIEGLPEVLYENLEHPRWDDVAARCLACGNCTMVCPTCFCSTVEEEAAVTGDEIARSRRWDSCFTSAFSELHGHPVRALIRSRYRQWLTHKLGGWWHQFGTSGCVGCGRCITWCPVGIDVTEEAAALRKPSDPAKGTPT
jgi:ferredoxin